MTHRSRIVRQRFGRRLIGFRRRRGSWRGRLSRRRFGRGWSWRLGRDRRAGGRLAHCRGGRLDSDRRRTLSDRLDRLGRRGYGRSAITRALLAGPHVRSGRLALRIARRRSRRGPAGRRMDRTLALDASARGELARRVDRGAHRLAAILERDEEAAGRGLRAASGHADAAESARANGRESKSRTARSESILQRDSETTRVDAV